MGVSHSVSGDGSDTPLSPSDEMGESEQGFHIFAKSAGSQPVSESSEAAASETVPHVFRWNEGGTKVSVAGDFSGGRKIPMVPSGADFVWIQPLSRESHHFKFCVDGKWQCSPAERVTTTERGTTVNTVDLTNFVTQKDETTKQLKADKDPLTRYGNVVPELSYFTQNSPDLPPQLRDIILNKSHSHHSQKDQDDSASALDVPNRAMVNHLYCTAMRHKLMVLGSTFKYREKHVTVVMYTVADP